MNEIDLLALARAQIQREAAVVAAIAAQLDDNLLHVARHVLACQGHVLVAGSGTSHATALRMAHLMCCVGTPALFIHPGDAQHGTSGAVTANDVVICISRGGETDEVNKLARIAKSRGATIVAFTEKPEATLGQISDFIVKVYADPKADLMDVITFGGSMAMSAMGDALCTVLLSLRGYSKTEFANTHPGGAFGKSISQSGNLCWGECASQ